MANARIALAICWDCWVLAMGCGGAGGWGSGKPLILPGPQWALRPARGGSMARWGPLGDALHCMPMHGLHLTADLHGCRCARIGSPMPMPWAGPAWMPWPPVACRRWGRFSHLSCHGPRARRRDGHGAAGRVAPVRAHLARAGRRHAGCVCVQLWRRPQRQSPCPDECLLALLEATTVQRHALQRASCARRPKALFHEFDPYRSPCSPGARHAAGRWP